MSSDPVDPFPNQPDHDIHAALAEIPKILAEQAFLTNGHPLQQSAVARVVTILGECLKRSEKVNGIPCTLIAKGFDPYHRSDRSLAALLDRARNASAHVFSELRNLKGIYINFATYDSRFENAYVVDGEAFDAGFDDDFTVGWGRLQVTLCGDIIPAYEWLRQRYHAKLPSIEMRKGPRGGS